MLTEIFNSEMFHLARATLLNYVYNQSSWVTILFTMSWIFSCNLISFSCIHQPQQSHFSPPSTKRDGREIGCAKLTCRDCHGCPARYPKNNRPGSPGAYSRSGQLYSNNFNPTKRERNMDGVRISAVLVTFFPCLFCVLLCLATNILKGREKTAMRGKNWPKCHSFWENCAAVATGIKMSIFFWVS